MKEKEFKVVENLSDYLLEKLYEKGLNEALGEGEEDDYSRILYVKDNNENYPVDGYLKIKRLDYFNKKGNKRVLIILNTLLFCIGL
mgnify:CR=1 FL=1